MKLRTIGVMPAAAILIVAAGFALFQWLTGPYRIASLRAGGDLRIEIIGVPDPGMDTGPSLYYEVRKQSSTLLGRHYFWVPYDSATRTDYRLLVLDGGNLIAVYEGSTPHCLSVIYDTATGEHYPCKNCALPPMAPYNHLYPLRDRLINRIIALTKDERYKAADTYVLGRND